MLDTTNKRCWRCDHFTKNVRRVRFRRKCRVLRLKYWKLIFYRAWSLSQQGVCTVTVVDDDMGHVNMVMRGFEKCIFRGSTDRIDNAQDARKNMEEEDEKRAQQSDQQKACATA